MRSIILGRNDPPEAVGDNVGLDIKDATRKMGHPNAKLTAEEFLTWEAAQAERHIFVAGDVFAMAGGTVEHNAAALAVAATLRLHLRGTNCKAFIGDVRVRVERADAYFYPDVLVTCAPGDLADPKLSSIREPRLIVEVLSPSTASYERGQKFALYRTLPSLEEYVLLDLETKTIDVFRKNPAGDAGAQAVWELHPSDAFGGTVRFQSVDWQGPASEFFDT